MAEMDVPSQPAKEGSRMYAIVVCLFASLGGLYFGYDQGVSGGVVVMRGFLNDFCVGFKGHDYTYATCTSSTADLPGPWSSFVANYTMLYDIGCVVGSIVGGYIAEKLGRRWTIMTAAIFFCVGTFIMILQPAHKVTMLLIVRFIQGVGVGNSSFSLPLFGAEMAPKELRGFLSGFMQMTIVTGLFLANVINEIVKNYTAGWRITNGVSAIPPVIVMLGIFCVPESPRWLYSHKGKDAAESTLKRLRQTENIQEELEAIGDQIEKDGEEAPWSALLEKSILKRVGITMMLQVLQQATGINAVFLFGPMIFKDIAGDGVLETMFVSFVNFVSTMPAMRWVDSTGRRKMLLIGAVGMVIGNVLSGVTFIAGCSGDTSNASCSKFAGYFIVLCTAFFVFNFAISWGPTVWVYAAEVFPYNVRAKGCTLSTMGNWLMAIVMTQVVKLYSPLGIDGVYFLFAVTCACCFLFVYFFCPETKGLMLEDIEALFGGPGAQAAVDEKYVGVASPDAQA